MKYIILKKWIVTLVIILLYFNIVGIDGMKEENLDLQENTITQNLENLSPQESTITQNVENMSLQESTIKQNLQVALQRPHIMNTIGILQAIKVNILSKIFNEFLPIRDILTLRKANKEFQMLLAPNDKDMVIFCKEFGFKQMENIPLIWFDLKYFLDQTYDNALKNMKMLNFKQDQYLVFTRDQKMIFWNNEEVELLYPKLILYKMTNKISNLNPNYESPKIYNKRGTAWAKITNEGNVITRGLKIDGGNSNEVQFQLKNVKMITSTYAAFAALLGNGNVVVWGQKDFGGQIPTSIENELINVQMILGLDYAFSALLEDGQVISWGEENDDGKLPEPIQPKFQDLKYFLNQSYLNALEKMTMSNLKQNQYSIFTRDKTVILWFENEIAKLHDQMISANNEEKNKISQLLQLDEPSTKIYSKSRSSWAKITKEKNVITGGSRVHQTSHYFEIQKGYGGDSDQVQSQLKNVKMIVSTIDAFAALLTNGNVVAWGNEDWGGLIPEEISSKLKNVKTIFSTHFAFAALLKDGSLFTWGRENDGGLIPDDIQTQVNQAGGVQMIFSNIRVFIALLKNGIYVGWGDENEGSQITPEIQTQLTNVKTIFSSKSAFAALSQDGTVCAWGLESSGGKIPDEIELKLMKKQVKTIFPLLNGFIALCKDGELIAWGKY